MQSEEAPDGLRERKKRARRLALRRAAVTMSLEKGFANVTIEDICEACEVSPRTFFNYFDTKEDAVTGVDESIFNVPAAEEFTRGGPNGDLLADVQQLLMRVVAEREKTRDEFDAWQELVHNEPVLLQAQFARMAAHERELRSLVEQRLEPESPADESDEEKTRRAHLVQIVTTAALMTMRTASERWRYDEAHDDIGSMIPAVFNELKQLFGKESA